MAQFVGDRHTGITVYAFLFRCELLRCRPAAGRTCPSGQLLVAHLCVVMSMPMYMLNSGLGTLGLETVKLLYVAHPLQNEAAASCEAFCGVQQRALRRRADGYFALAPTLGPTG